MVYTSLVHFLHGMLDSNTANTCHQNIYLIWVRRGRKVGREGDRLSPESVVYYSINYYATQCKDLKRT